MTTAPAVAGSRLRWVAGVTVYILAARLLRIDELTSLLRFRRRPS